MSTHLIRRGAFVLGPLVATLAIAACGSSSTTSTSGSAAASASSSTSSGSASGSGSGRRGAFGNPAQRAKLVACLKQHGVTLPSRPAGGGPPPGSGSASGSATTPSGGAPGGGGSRGFFYGGGGGGGGGGARANPKFRTALKACGVNFRATGRFNPAARQATINKFVTCVAQHGYKLPKPNFSGKGAVFPRSIESNSKFQAAAKACAGDLRPSGPPQGGGAPPPSNA